MLTLEAGPAEPENRFGLKNIRKHSENISFTQGYEIVAENWCFQAKKLLA